MLSTRRTSSTFLLPVAFGLACATAVTSAAAQGTMVPAASASATPQPAPSATGPAPAASAQPAPSSTPADTTTTTISTEGSPTIQENQAPVFVAPPVPTVPPAGQWVYSDSYGWIWVPEGTTSVIVQEQPYVYLYTPIYGWTWYGSPWGRGVFYVGPWVHHGFGPARVWHRGGLHSPHVVVRPRVVAPPVIHHGGASRGGGGHRGHR
jgi:hypothetical protein